MPASHIGMLHPGEMGSSVGAALRSRGVSVCWASAGRSEASARRAERADLADSGDLATLVRSCEVVFSVCPPHAAVAQARAVMDQGFRGCYVDANAIAPDSARSIGRDVEQGGAQFVDGGIVGPPPQRAGTTRLYLSGDLAASLAPLFEDSPLAAIPMAGGAGAASALKMCFAAYTKGTTALLAAIRALASRERVDANLLSEWEQSIPDLPARSEAGARAAAPKAWRFVGEMEEIASTFRSAGLPDGFHRAAAEIYRRMEPLRELDSPELQVIVEALLASSRDS